MEKSIKVKKNIDKNASRKIKKPRVTVKKYTMTKMGIHEKHVLKSSPSTLRIISQSKKELEEMLKSNEHPQLNRLFRKKNIEKLKTLPKELTDYTNYSKLVKKEFKELKENKKYQPNQDFYNYVNSQWIEAQTKELVKNPEYYVQIDDFRIIQDKVYKEVIGYTHEFIKENASTRKAKSIKAVTHCIQNASKAKGLKYSQTILNEVTNFIETEDMYGLLAYVNQDEIFSWQSPIVWNTRPDEKNVKKYISHLSPPQLGIYDYFIYIDDPADNKKTKEFKTTFRKKYFEFIDKTFKTLLPNSEDRKEFKAQHVWDTELELMEAMGCNKIKKEDPDYYNVVTKKELEEDYGLNWSFFCEKLGKKSAFPDEYWVGKSGFKTVPNKVVVSSLNALKCITTLMKKNWSTPKWKTYWLFIFYKQMIRFDWDWAGVYYDFYGKFVKGQPVRFPKEIYSIFPLSFCYNTFLTEQYVAKKNDPLLEAYVKNMVDDLKEIFIKKIERNTWLSPSTKKAALNKLHKLEVIVGTPNKLREDPILDYKDDDPWYNMALLAGWKRTKFIELEGKDVIDIPEIDWNEFKLVGTQAYMVNAYYRPTSNTIYCPLAYIQKPFIDMDQRGIEYNLAYIGYTMGHELSHSLDDMGSKFDADGNMHNWWTDEDRKKYKAKINDVIKQYEEVAKRDGIDFDASIGVGEDLADISGLALVEEYLYYFQILHDDIPIIKNLSLAAFYTYSAIQSRQKIFDSALPAQLKQNPHPLEKYRCNCPLSRLSLFRELYQVEKGDGMYWHNTDTIW